MGRADTPTVAPFGKRGELRMLFELNDQGRSILRDLYRRAPIVVQQALYFDERLPSMPCVYILSAGGPVVEGDELTHHITLREGACAHISTGAATKVAQMSGGRAELRQYFRLCDNSYLEYLPEMTIPCQGAHYKTSCEVVAAPSATLFYSDIYTSGRRFSAERYLFRRLDSSILISRPTGERLFSERQLFEPATLAAASVGVMAGWDIFASVVIIAPPEITHSLYCSIEPRLMANIALGVHLLPFDSGLMCRIIGDSTTEVKTLVRELCSLLRQRVWGVGLQEEFVWR